MRLTTLSASPYRLASCDATSGNKNGAGVGVTQNDVIATGIWSALYGSHELNISPSNRGSSLTGHLASVRRRRGERDHIFALGLSCKVPETKKGKKKK